MTDFLSKKRSLWTKAGFTLIELLVVIAIIGVLASIVLASLTTARRKSRDARRISDIKQIQLALELYFDSQPAPTYPVATTGVLNCNEAAAPLSYGLEVLVAPPAGQTPYIPQVPRDPNAAVGTAGRCYKYASVPGTTRTRYHLGASLEDTAHPALSGDQDCDSAAATVTCPGAGATYTAGFVGGTGSPDAGATSNSCADAAITTLRCYDVTP